MKTYSHDNPPNKKKILYHGRVTKKIPESPTSDSYVPPKQSVLARIRGRFQEKPASKAEIDQLRLDTVREELKTRKQLARSKRPSRFGGFGGGEPRPSYRRGSSRAPPESGSFLFGPSSRGGGFMDMGEGPSLDFITGANSKSRGRRQDSGFGQGLTDLF